MLGFLLSAINRERQKPTNNTTLPTSLIPLLCFTIMSDTAFKKTSTRDRQKSSQDRNCEKRRLITCSQNWSIFPMEEIREDPPLNIMDSILSLTLRLIKFSGSAGSKELLNSIPLAKTSSRRWQAKDLTHSIHSQKSRRSHPRRPFIKFTSYFIKEPIRSFIPATTLAGFLTIPAASRALSAN